MRPALDLTRYHWRHRHGDITAYGTWWLASDSGPRPCLVLIPTHARSYRRSTPCVVPLDEAWAWSEAIGDGAYAARTATAFADALGLDAGNVNDVLRVRSIVADHLGDLIAIPPMPEAMRDAVVLGEAKVTDRQGGDKTGTVVRHHEVIERV